MLTKVLGAVAAFLVLPLVLRFLQGPVWPLAALLEQSLDFALCLEQALA